MADPILTVDAVNKLMLACLSEIMPDDPVLVNGIRNDYAFDSQRIKLYEDRIVELLSELPLPFRKDSGGGWSFLQAWYGPTWRTMDRFAHQTMEYLFCLGIAAGKAEWMPVSRDLWSGLPGGVPYVSLDLPDKIQEIL